MRTANLPPAQRQLQAKERRNVGQEAQSCTTPATHQRSVGLGATPRELLKVSKIMNDDSLLLASNGTTSRLLHQEEHSLAVLVLARVDFLFVRSKVFVVQEGGVIAQVTPGDLS